MPLDTVTTRNNSTIQSAKLSEYRPLLTDVFRYCNKAKQCICYALFPLLLYDLLYYQNMSSDSIV
jgi:hypothetical protein